MKVFISVDIEGCVGVLSEFHTRREGDDFKAARLRMTREVSAAVEGCVAAGATRVLVNDSHAAKTNLVLEEMHPAAEVILGNTKPLNMMEGIDRDCDAAMYVGYHTAAGVAGQLSHTYASAVIWAVRLNGKACSEFDINAAVAGQLGVPSVLVTGDDRLAAFVRERYPRVHALAVKEYRGRCSSLAPHPSVACEEIRKAAERALLARRRIPPIALKHCEIEVDLMNEVATDYCSLIPGVEKIGDRTVRLETRTALEAYKLLLLIVKAGRL
ncbi:MAG: M55 family metallopeptidase [Ignavibacteriales bacterium]|nr:M55 family metallopeptidase [Ignavibacteriales bacterium]